jgi:hypothetical protein
MANIRVEDGSQCYAEEQMSAATIAYWDFDSRRDDPVTCPACNWTGSALGIQDFHADLFDVCCPECDGMILIVPYPTVVETQTAAAAGNQRAAESLPELEAKEQAHLEWSRRADETLLREPAELPALVGDQLLIDWDFEDRDGEQWTVLRHGDVQIWREVAFWEGIGRFAEVVKILQARYGSRLIEVRPTPASELSLWGDKSGVDSMIAEINTSLHASN